jgi:hypothetical protein
MMAPEASSMQVSCLSAHDGARGLFDAGELLECP